jgi:PhnB protein
MVKPANRIKIRARSVSDGFLPQEHGDEIMPNPPPDFDRVIPHLIFKNASQAFAFYEKAFGAQEIMRMPGPNGKGVLHGSIKIGSSVIFLADEMPHMNVFSPQSLKGTTVSLHLHVPDVDQQFHRAIAAGAQVILPPTNMFWGDRFCKIRDPFGHEWALATHVEDVSQEDMLRRGQEMMTKMAQQQQQ